MCLPGLHQAVAQEITRRVSPASRILDIAAGSGAFTRRLTGMGMLPIANDADPSRWAAPEIDLMNVDLNGDFADAFCDAGIDAIAAIEIIEHLENPRAFLRTCREIVPSGAFMFVTTPNVTSAVSRGMFLRSGRTVFFAKDGECAGDHITLLPWWILAGHAEAAGWDVIDTTFAGRYENLGFRARISRLLATMLGKYRQPDEKKFGCTVMTLRKS
jgi:hypothetical protein